MCHSFSSKEPVSFNFVAPVTVCSDLRAQESKMCQCFHFFSIYLPWNDGPRCHDIIFWMLSFKPGFSLSSFTFIKRLFSFSFLSANRVLSSAHLRLLIFVLAILIPACASSSLACHIICPVYKLWRRQWHPTPVLLPGKSHEWRSLVGCSPWGCGKSDTTERLHFHFSLSCIGEGNGNPLQCSCLENPRDGGASWAAVYGVAQSRTWLKQQQ